MINQSLCSGNDHIITEKIKEFLLIICAHFSLLNPFNPVEHALLTCLKDSHFRWKSRIPTLPSSS